MVGKGDFGVDDDAKGSCFLFNMEAGFTSTSSSPLKVITVIWAFSKGPFAGVEGRFGVVTLRPWAPAWGPLRPTK